MPPILNLMPLETLYDDAATGVELALPAEIDRLYGALRFPSHPDRVHVISNFVSTLDGVVSLDPTGRSGGGDISGSNQHDRMVMGLLRSAADAIVLGAGSLRSAPGHRLTAEHVFPALAESYRQVRRDLGKSEASLSVIVTARGDVDLALPLFQDERAPALIVTTAEGQQLIDRQAVPPSVRIAAVAASGSVSARAVLGAIGQALAVPPELILVEGGPRLIGSFFGECALDELFLTAAPQVAGRDGTAERPGFVAGHRFAPESPIWGTLVSLKRAESHLFLRYAFGTAQSYSQCGF